MKEMEERKERKDAENEVIDRIGDLLWSLGGQEMAIATSKDMATIELAGRNPRLFFEAFIPEALPAMDLLPGETRDDAMKILGYLLQENIMYRGFACAILKTVVEPLAQQIADLGRSIETLNVALANKEA